MNYFREKENEIYIIAPDNCLKNYTIVNTNNLHYDIINIEYSQNEEKCGNILFRKPTVLICGLSLYNQQITLEIKLRSMFIHNEIDCYFVSYYQKYVNELIQNINLFRDNTEVIQWLINMSHKVESNDIVCLALPCDIGNTEIYNYGTVEQIIELINPDYIICCIPREKDILLKPQNIEMWFKYKYGREINALYVSDYETNRSMGETIKHPMKSLRQIDCMEKTKCKLFCKDSLSILFDDIIRTITLPNGISII